MICIEAVILSGIFFKLLLILQDELVNLFPFVLVLIEIVDIVAFTFKDGADGNIAIFEDFGLVGVLKDNRIYLFLFSFYWNYLLSILIQLIDKT